MSCTANRYFGSRRTTEAKRSWLVLGAIFSADGDNKLVNVFIQLNGWNIFNFPLFVLLFQKSFKQSYRLDHQPLFGKGARAPPPKPAVLLGEGRRPDTRERRKSSQAILRLVQFLSGIFFSSSNARMTLSSVLSLVNFHRLRADWMNGIFSLWFGDFVGKSQYLKNNQIFSLCIAYSKLWELSFW